MEVSSLFIIVAVAIVSNQSGDMARSDPSCSSSFVIHPHRFLLTFIITLLSLGGCYSTDYFTGSNVCPFISLPSRELGTSSTIEATTASSFAVINPKVWLPPLLSMRCTANPNPNIDKRMAPSFGMISLVMLIHTHFELLSRWLWQSCSKLRIDFHVHDVLLCLVEPVRMKRLMEVKADGRTRCQWHQQDPARNMCQMHLWCLVDRCGSAENLTRRRSEVELGGCSLPATSLKWASFTRLQCCLLPKAQNLSWAFLWASVAVLWIWFSWFFRQLVWARVYG